jgi:hypothetical protein
VASGGEDESHAPATCDRLFSAPGATVAAR